MQKWEVLLYSLRIQKELIFSLTVEDHDDGYLAFFPRWLAATRGERRSLGVTVRTSFHLFLLSAFSLGWLGWFSCPFQNLRPRDINGLRKRAIQLDFCPTIQIAN